MNTFVDLLIEILSTKQRTPSWLGKQLGCGASEVEKWLDGSTRPSKANIVKIGYVLNLSEAETNQLIIAQGNLYGWTKDVSDPLTLIEGQDYISDVIAVYQYYLSQPTESIQQMQVFLCHASTDKPAVRKLYKFLSDTGFRPWLDEYELLPGRDWQLEISKAVRKADVVLVCLSKHAVNKRGYVQKEIRIALDLADEQPEGATFIIPVRLDECDMPERLSRWQWVNLYEKEGYDRLLKSLYTRAAELYPLTPQALDADNTNPSTMTSPSWDSQKTKTLSKYYNELIEEYEAAYNQLEKTLSDVDKVRIKRHITEIEGEIEKTKIELDQLNGK